MQTMRHVLSSGILLPLLTGLALVGCGHLSSRDQSRMKLPTYRVDGAGRPASEAARWTIRFSSSDRVGIISGCARCGDTAYLIDLEAAVVHRVDLVQGKVVGRIGRQNELVEPRAVTADCDHDRLYVVDYRTVVVFRMSDGTAIRTYQLPEGVSIRGSLAAMTRDGRELYLPALWEPSRGFSTTFPQDALFKGAKLGLRLALDTGTTQAVATPIDLGCRGYAIGCWQTSLGEIEAPAGQQWAVIQGLIPEVAIWSSSTGRPRMLSVASPMFKTDGRALKRGEDREAQIAWSAGNSKIDALAVFDDAIAVVHSNVSPARDGALRDSRNDVFLNLVSTAGEALVCDMLLSGYPVGFDRDSLIVADFGELGPRPGPDAFDLVSIRPAALLATPATGHR